ncbi:hypothetical protein ACFLKB_10980 [Clostridium sp. FAM 1755]
MISSYSSENILLAAENKGLGLGVYLLEDMVEKIKRDFKFVS